MADYVEPGARNCENTINQLMDVLDDTQLIQVVDDVKMDDLKKRGPQDRSKINMHEDNEVSYWTKELGVSKEKLQKAVDKVGNPAAAVRKELAA